MNGSSLRPRNSFLKLITVVFSLIPLLGVKIIHLVDRTDLFKISNLDLGGKAVVTSLYSSLVSTETEREREPVGRVQGFTRVTTRETALPK
jgi:hypothetical protein